MKSGLYFVLFIYWQQGFDFCLKGIEKPVAYTMQIKNSTHYLFYIIIKRGMGKIESLGFNNSNSNIKMRHYKSSNKSIKKESQKCQYFNIYFLREKCGKKWNIFHHHKIEMQEPSRIS